MHDPLHEDGDDQQGMLKYTTTIDGRKYKVSFDRVAGPPLVRAATGEVTNPESLGGGDVHTKISGVADYLADDDEHALAIARQCVKNIDTKNNIRNQNRPCPFQEIIFESTKPVDSRSK